MPGYGFELMAGNESAPDNQKRIAAFRRDGLTLAGRTCHNIDDYNGFRAAARLSGQREDVLLKVLAISKRASVSASSVAVHGRTPCLDFNDADMQATCRATFGICRP